MVAFRRHSIRPDVAFLYLFSAALLLSEAAKHIFLALFLLAWTFQRFRAHSVGVAWSRAITIAGFFGLCWTVSAAGAAANGYNAWEFLDHLYPLLLFIVLTGGAYDSGQLQRALWILVLGALLSLGIGFWERDVSRTAELLYLASVPNHGDSNLILLLLIAFTTSWLLDHYRNLPLSGRAGGVFIVGTLVYSLLELWSRSAILILLVLTLYLLLSQARRSLRSAAILGGAIAAVIAAAVLSGHSIVEKFVERYEAYGLNDPRLEIASVSLDAWRQQPWFGYGVDNFKQVAMAEIASRREEDFLIATDAHNMYVQVLVEGGLIAALGLLVLLAAWGRSLFAKKSPSASTYDAWPYRASLSAWTIVVLGGLTNTFLQGEPPFVLALVLAGALGHARSGHPGDATRQKPENPGKTLPDDPPSRTSSLS